MIKPQSSTAHGVESAKGHAKSATKPGSDEADALVGVVADHAAPAMEPRKKEGWYVLTAKGNSGPFEAWEIVAAAKDGEIYPGTELRYGKTGRIVLACEVPGLFPSRAEEASSGGR